MTDDKLRQEAEAAGEEVTAVCWCAGQTCSGCEANSKALFVKGYLAHAAKAEVLVRALKEFDEAAPTVENLLNTIRAITREVGTASDMQIFGFAGVALDKLKQSKAREAALRAEVERLKATYNRRYSENLENDNAELRQERDELRAEVERLKRELAELQDGKETMSRFLHEKRMSAECERTAKLRAEVDRLKRELAEAKLIISGKTFYDEVAAERERAAKLVDALDWAFQGIEHFTTDEDQGQVKFLRDGIWKTVAEYKGGKA